MAMQNSFKQYARGQRTQLTESSFGMGMYYTNIPLSEGFSKLLVNVNISDDGFSLSPRDGLSIHSSSVKGTDLETVDFSQYKIVDCKVVYKEDDVMFHHVVLSQYDSDCNLIHMIIKDNEHSFIAPITCAYHKEEIPSIHNVPIVDNSIVSPIGTFAFNNDYYFFRTDGTLFHSKWEANVMTNVAVVMPVVSPRDVPTPGYNMLHTEPFKFEDKDTVEGARTFVGIVCYKDAVSYIPELNPRRNTEYTYRCYYENKATSDKIQWEWKEPGADVWQKIGAEQTVTAGPIITKFTSPVNEFMIRVTCTSSASLVTSQLAKVYTFDDNPDRKSNFINYSLGTTKNLTYWKQRLVVGGTVEDRTMLFMSLPDEPGYFAYPNWTDQFSEPIMSVVPFLESLLVFTTTKLYQITLDMAGTFSKICLQENLNISTWDKHLTQIVKNMLFFKSGNYYYMVVPKANSMTGELTIAPISKNMKEFFDNFEASVSGLMQDVYDYTEEMDLVHYYNFLDYESIYNVYMYKVQGKENLYINVCLLYNSVKRYWKINLYESNGQLVPLIQDATKSGILVQLSKTTRDLDLEELPTYPGHTTIDALRIDYLKHDPVNLTDNAMLIKNYQYVDTGYRDHTSDVKKRYRELQLVIENPTCQDLKLYPSFFIDGDDRQLGYIYEPSFDAVNKTVAMTKTPANPLSVTGNTVLDEWVLDFSEFPSTTVWKLRTPVSGKGYCPRLALFSNNEVPFKLLRTCWVSRIMNSR